MKLVVITADCAAAASVGGPIARRARIFDLPDEISDHIRESAQLAYNVVELVVEFDRPDEPPQ